MAKLELIKVRTTYPCCGKPARFAINPALPKQSFLRVCRECETGYHVQVKTRIIGKGAIRLHLSTWLDTTSDEYEKLYGEKRIYRNRKSF